ncbi:MAG: hypothetical protein ACK5JT_03960, partial [Hyphomicrobiaceae bacterium]
AGDSIHLRSDVPQMAWASGGRNARIMMVTSFNNQTAKAVERWAQMTSSAAGPKGRNISTK